MKNSIKTTLIDFLNEKKDSKPKIYKESELIWLRAEKIKPDDIMERNRKNQLLSEEPG